MSVRRLPRTRSEASPRQLFQRSPDKPWVRKNEDGADWRQKANNRISRAIGGLKTRVGGLPIAEDYLTFESAGQNQHRWRRASPTSEVVLEETRYTKLQQKNTRRGGEELFQHLSFVSAAKAAR